MKNSATRDALRSTQCCISGNKTLSNFMNNKKVSN